MKYLKHTLSNGLTILEVPSKDAESVVVDIFVKTGSRSESPEENGISHFLEHFLFKGTAKFPSALDISSLVDSIGGEMNANTGKEHTQYFIKAAAKHLPLIFEVLTDMIQSPLLDAEELEREKNVIVEEINMYKDTPMAEIDNILEGLMWPHDALGRDIAGTRETVMRFTREMFVRYIAAHYQAPNIIIGVSGKYNQRSLHALIKKHWVDVPKKRFHRWLPARDVQSSPRLKVSFKATEQAHLSIGFKAYPYGDKRNSAAAVLGAVMGGGMSSRLFMEVRERSGLAYYVRAYPGSYQDTGAFTIGSGVQVDKTAKAISVILEEAKKLKYIPLHEQELQKAKEYIKGKTTLALEDNQVRLDWILERCAFFKNIETPEEAFARLDRVTSQDVLRVANELFQPTTMSMAIIGPFKDERMFKPLLKI